MHTPHAQLAVVGCLQYNYFALNRGRPPSAHDALQWHCTASRAAVCVATGVPTAAGSDWSGLAYEVNYRRFCYHSVASGLSQLCLAVSNGTGSLGIMLSQIPTFDPLISPAFFCELPPALAAQHAASRRPHPLGPALPGTLVWTPWAQAPCKMEGNPRQLKLVVSRCKNGVASFGRPRSVRAPQSRHSIIA
jgi:hypothetical protein